MMDLAIRDSGVNLIDTAEQYPIPSDLRRPEGSTEEIIGEWVAQGGAARRDGVVLATKITGGARISRRGLIDAVDGSLRRLKTDRIDLLQTHWPARYSPQSNWGQSLMYRKSTQRRMGMDFADFDEITQTLGELVAAGKIRGYGFCNDNSVGLVACAEAAKRLNVAPPCVMQNDFSIINRRIEENGVAEASAPWHYNAGFFAYNALAGGVLSGKYLEDPPAWERPRGRRGGLGGSGDAFGSTPGSSSGPGGLKRDLSRFDDESWGRTLYRYRSGPADDATRAYAALAKQYGLGLGGDEGGSGNGDDGGALTELALRWCCGREAVTSVLLGATSAEQLSRGLAVFKKVGSGGKAGNLLPDELEWSIDQVHMRNRLPIFSNDDVATVSRGIGTGGIGEPIP